MNLLELENLSRGWRRRAMLRTILFALGGAGIFAAPFLPVSFPLAGKIFAVMLAWFLILWWLCAPPAKTGLGRVAEHLNRTHPELEESAGLWLRAPGSLSVPERLQRERVEAAWAELRARGIVPGGQVPRGYWREPAAWFAVGMAALVLGFAWRAMHPPRVEGLLNRERRVPETASPLTASPVNVALSEAKMTVVPPAYTGKATRKVAGLDAEVEEGATLIWHVRLNGPPVAEVRVIFEATGSPELALREPIPDAGWEGSLAVGTHSGLFHFVVRPSGGPETQLREVGSLKILPDAPPVVTILQPSGPRTELDPAAGATTLPVEIRVSDDYGVSDARIVATVAKGSGEAVKFRERTLAFDPPTAGDVTPTRTERRFTATLDLAALGMEPGDELYFHVDAEDNHPPTAHRARSETRFVVLRGPASAPSLAGRGLAGVNLVPEYFRSERQIILDTEKLLAERDKLPEREFRRRAEDLGADQALLRLRYGQFVGEESEAGAGGGGDHAEVNLNPLRAGVPGGVPSDLVHRHDQGEAPAVNHDPRAGLRTAMRLRLEHDDQARGGGGHDGAPTAPDAGVAPTAGQIVAPFVDQHDSQDAATLFDHETKASLRAVLAAMWTAEGFLRTIKPAEALEPEHRALDLLKELQQGERLYVQRVGFEPTPLRVAERRGKGDVADVPERATATGNNVPEAVAQAGVREALAALPGGNGGGRTLTPELQRALGQAAPALSEAAAREGGGFLEGLRALRRWEEAGENAFPGPGDVAAVRSALLRLSPGAEEHPRRTLEVAPGLVRRTEDATGGSLRP